MPLILSLLWPIVPTQSLADPVIQEDSSIVTSTKIEAQVPPKGMVPKGIYELGSGFPFSAYAFVADKSRRTLTVWKRTEQKVEFLEAHPMDYGKKDGDKRFSGDLKTPEGVYFFQKQLNAPNLNYDEYGSFAFTMDYPNHFDRLEKKTGHGIWLHGIPPTKTLSRGSRGCVVVKDEIITNLGKFIDLEKTPIIVQDKVEYIPQEVAQTETKELLSVLNNWRQAWELKNLEEYMSFYAPEFKSGYYNWDSWKIHKQGLNDRYEFIKVHTANPIILAHDNEAVIRFVQHYRSDKNSDIGEKSLYLKKTNGKYQIVGEKWRAFTPELLAQIKPINESETTEN